MIDLSRLTLKCGDYRFAPRAAVTDRVLLEVAGAYETEVSNRFIAIKPADLPQRYSADSRVLATIKYDGEGVFVYFEAGRDPDIFTFNTPSGRVRVGLPCLAELGARLRDRGVKKALLRAELYIREAVGERRSASADVNRASHSTDPGDAAKLRLALLDGVMIDGRDLRGQQNDFLTTWNLLSEIAGTDPDKLAHRAEGGEVSGADLERLFDERTSTGLEGMVIRRFDRAEVCKLKPRLTIDAAVVGFVEGEFEGHHGVTSLLTALSYPDGKTLQVIARVGSGFNDQDRMDWLTRLSPHRVEAPLAMCDSDGRPVRFVKPQFIVELEAEDMLPADEESGMQVFTWSGAYNFDGISAVPRLLFPTFHRLRTDKEFNAASIRLTQITGRELPAPELISRDLPPLEIERRSVWTKEVKGAAAVRKLVVAKRPPVAGAFPYVIWWTDFSAGRKTPLEVTTLFAHTEVRAAALAEKLIGENIVKGWELHGAPKCEATAEEKPKAKRKAAKKAADAEQA